LYVVVVVNTKGARDRTLAHVTQSSDARQFEMSRNLLGSIALRD
jgi:hypothetical protein